MKCPKCDKAGCRYNQRRPDHEVGKKKEFKRSDFSAKCKHCGWAGSC